MKTDKQLITDLIIVFPGIKDDILDEDYINITSLQIGCFRQFTQQAIDANDLEKVSRCFLFVNENYDNVSDKTRNSFAVSYLGKLNIDKNSPVARLLSAKFIQIRKELAEYYESLEKDERLNNFIKTLANE